MSTLPTIDLDALDVTVPDLRAEFRHWRNSSGSMTIAQYEQFLAEDGALLAAAQQHAIAHFALGDDDSTGFRPGGKLGLLFYDGVKPSPRLIRMYLVAAATYWDPADVSARERARMLAASRINRLLEEASSALLPNDTRRLTVSQATAFAMAAVLTAGVTTANDAVVAGHEQTYVLRSSLLRATGQSDAATRDTDRALDTLDELLDMTKNWDRFIVDVIRCGEFHTPHYV